jgi:hypothetical protein
LKWSANASLCEHIQSKAVLAQPILFPAIEIHFKPQSGSDEISETMTEGFVEVVALVVSVVVVEAAKTSGKATIIRRILEAIIILVYGGRAWIRKTAYFAR